MADQSSLDDWLVRIGQIHPVGWDLGLERVASVGASMGLLHPAAQVVLVAGTNGKGSTCEYLTHLAMAAGLTVGTSTSPHLFRFNERIRIDGQPVDDQAITGAFARIDQARGETTLTYFEFATLASLLIFQDRHLDVAVLEIGLGGRLDAMNIVAPDLTLITSISMDHESWLGDTREAIAREKAGIMRAGITCVVTDRDPPQSLIDAAADTGASLRLLGQDFPVVEMETRLPADSLAGAMEAARCLGWLAGRESDHETVRELAARVTMPGRCQLVETRDGIRVLLDVGHNPAAALYLARQVRSMAAPGLHILVGIYRDKDIEGVLQAFTGQGALSWHLVDLPGERGASAAEILDRLAESERGRATTYAKMSAAVEGALSRAAPGEILLVFGSFETVAGALRQPGIAHIS